VRRGIRVLVLANNGVEALAAAVDEAGDTSRFSRLINIVSVDKRIALVVANDRTEGPPDVGERRVVGLVVEVVVDGFAYLSALLPRWDGLVRAGCRPVVAVVVSPRYQPRVAADTACECSC
jgi:hypothetical protein